MATELKRCLSLTELVIYGVGLILGAGIYVLIGSAAGIAGNMLWFSFVFAAIVASFTAMSYAELSALFPEAGAEYVYVKKAFGWEKVAWFVGFIGIIIGFSTASAVALGFARYLSYFLPMNQILLAIGLLVSMTVINLWGIKESARFNAIAALIEVGGLLLIIIAGAYFIFKGDFPLANLTEFPPLAKDSSSSWLPIVSASALIFFAYMGFEDIANIAEEAENPVEILPKAFIYTLLISTIIYILVAVVAVSIVPFKELASAEQPLSLIMSTMMSGTEIGGKSSQLIAIIALFATANTVLITLMVCARMMYGMAKSKTLPSALAKVHPKRQTPYVATIVVSFITVGFLFFKEVEVLAAISDVGIFTLFFMVNLSNIILRYRRPELQRSWRTPLNIGRLPVISVLGVISCGLMLVTINHPVHIGDYVFSAQVVGFTIFALSIPMYFIFNRK